MCRALALLALSALVLTASRARAEERRCERPGGVRAHSLRASPAPAALQPLSGPNFVLLPDSTALAEAACAPQTVANTVLVDALERLRIATGIDPQIAVVLTTAPLSCPSLFYVSVANDTRGIGYQHEDPREVFDDSPRSRLEGVAFLNDFPYWQRHPAEFARAFNHELGHRFGARVHVEKTGFASDAILGRQRLHWSYFLDTGGSPLEGNRWADAGEGRLLAETPLGSALFSDLDLYLMGVLPAERVAPGSLVQAGPAPGRDCLGRTLTAASPPQSCGALAFDGARVPFTIADVIAAEGPRVPAAQAEQRTLDVAFVVLGAGTGAPSASTCHLLSDSFAQRVEEFARATGGSVTLHNLTDSEASCDAWPPAPRNRHAEAASGCHFAPRSQPGLWVTALLVLVGARLRARPRA